MQLEMLPLRHTPLTQSRLNQSPLNQGRLNQESLRFAGAAAICLAAFCSIASAAAKSETKQDPAALFHSLPMRFEQDAKGNWSARGAGYAIGLEASALNLRTLGGVVRLSFDGAKAKNSAWEPSGKNLAPTNYFKGHTYRSADAYSHLRRSRLYPGIDIVYYGSGGKLEYDFDLAPGADPSRIRMRFQGADKVSLNESGGVVLKTKSGDIVQQLPVVYQMQPDGEKVAVNAAYRVASDGSVRLKLGNYDRTRALVIDPAILFDFWFTGSNAQAAISLGHDAQGYEYIAGWTYSPDFTPGGNGYDPNYSSNEDGWVVKFNQFATRGESVILYSTYFGGALDDDLRSMAVDASGNIYLGGTTLSPDFPISSNAYASTLPNTSANLNGFVAELNSNILGPGSLVYSTFFGGSMNLVINSVAQFEGQIYATGWTVTPDMPAASTLTPFQPTLSGSYDSFIAVFDPLLTDGTSTLTFSSYLGGSSEDIGRSIDVDAQGRAYIAGYTFSINFPMAGTSFQPTYNDGGGDAFLTVIDPGVGAIVYSTFVGGTNIDVATKVRVDQSTGNVAIAGFTFSADFPLTVNAAQPIFNQNGNGTCNDVADTSCSDAFIEVLNPFAGSPVNQLIYGTYFGGSDDEVAYDLRYGNGLYYLAGYTFSKNLPVTTNALNPISAGGGTDAFEVIIDPNNALVYSSYITGPGNQVAYAVDYDAAGNIYATGYATGDIFPNNTPPHNVPGNYDVFFLLVSPH